MKKSVLPLTRRSGQVLDDIGIEAGLVPQRDGLGTVFSAQQVVVQTGGAGVHARRGRSAEQKAPHAAAAAVLRQP